LCADVSFALSLEPQRRICLAEIRHSPDISSLVPIRKWQRPSGYISDFCPCLRPNSSEDSKETPSMQANTDEFNMFKVSEEPPNKPNESTDQAEKFARLLSSAPVSPKISEPERRRSCLLKPCFSRL